MKINNILIKNFKSIKELTISLNEYGKGIKKSKTSFLVGVNESGKSAILEAISLLNKGFSGINYNDYCFLEAQEDDDYIDIYVDLDIESINFYREQISKELSLSKEFVKEIRIKDLTKNIYLKGEDHDETYSISIDDNIKFYKYIVYTSVEVIGGKTIAKESIELLQEANKVEERITENNAKSYLKENQKLLTRQILESKISDNLQAVFNANIPKIQIWKPSPKYLINGIIDLTEFKEDTSISIPLKNIFHIYGKKTDEEIKKTIERALNSQARTDELQDQMTTKVTRHINKIWKEHKIKIRLSINGNNCQVQIEDKDKKYAYYTMSQRSDGFKQFISLILSLSAQNENSTLKNKIILIDEPEVHLHPSGVKYMKDEILKIGKNNYVVVATHSQYMVDTSTPERHWIVQKKKSETEISQVHEDTPIEDDEVIASAFGLSLFKELLPENIIIVEGQDDKNIISHSIKILNEKFFYSIKPAGGASKAPGFARLLNEESVKAFILFDADKEGKDNKNKILREQGEAYSGENTFTLKDLLNSLPNNSTIEDLLPIDFVKSFFETEMDQSFTLEESRAVIHQIKNQCQTLKTNKYKLDSLKLKLSIAFTEKYKTKAEIDQFERLTDLTNALVNKIGSTVNS